MSWESIYASELKKRRQLAKKDPKNFKKLQSLNPWGLLEDCNDHVFVPATHFYILGKGKEKSSLRTEGLDVRAFYEALPFKEEGYSIVPQVCCKCSACREKQISIRFYANQMDAYGTKKKQRKQKSVKVKDLPTIDWF